MEVKVKFDSVSILKSGDFLPECINWIVLPWLCCFLSKDVKSSPNNSHSHGTLCFLVH